MLEKTLKSTFDCKRSKQSILKEINPEYSLKGLMLKLQYFGHQLQRADSLGKTTGGHRKKVASSSQGQRPQKKPVPPTL